MVLRSCKQVTVFPSSQGISRFRKVQASSIHGSATVSTTCVTCNKGNI